MTTAAYDPHLVNLLAAPAARAREIADISRWKLTNWRLRDLVKPTIQRKIGARAVRLYTVDDLLALLVLAQLRHRKMPMHHLRALVARLRDRGYDKPLAQLTFATHGRQIYFQHPDGTWEGDRVPDQTVIREVIPLDAIRSRIIDALPQRTAVPGAAERVRGRVGSKPVFAGTRIPVDTVARWLGHGGSAAEILAAYPDLTVEDIEMARRELAAASN